MTDDYIIVGIDPGISGAIAAIRQDGTLDYAIDMPVADKWVSPPLLREHAEDHRIRAVAIEHVRSMPGQGVSSTFKFGDANGAVRTAFGMFHPITSVTPQKWKKTFGIKGEPKDQKEQARRLAIEMWPTSSALFDRKKDHGRAEAALIAEHHRRTRQ